MVPTRQMTPHVPLRVEEIVEEVHAAFEAGINIAHLHARDEATGEPSCSKETYARLIERIRSFAKDLVICVSLSGRTFNESAKRAAPLELEGDLKPDMGSLTLSSLNFAQSASVNAPDMIQALAKAMLERGILPGARGHHVFPGMRDAFWPSPLMESSAGRLSRCISKIRRPDFLGRITT